MSKGAPACNCTSTKALHASDCELQDTSDTVCALLDYTIPLHVTCIHRSSLQPPGDTEPYSVTEPIAPVTPMVTFSSPMTVLNNPKQALFQTVS